MSGQCRLPDQERKSAEVPIVPAAARTLLRGGYRLMLRRSSRQRARPEADKEQSLPPRESHEALALLALL